MTRRNRAQAPKGVAGTCRDRRRSKGLRREAWVRPFRRLHRALDTSLRLINTTLLTAADCGRRAHGPIRAVQELSAASDLLIRASTRLRRAARGLAEVYACIAREPENAGQAPELLVAATARWVVMTGWLGKSADQVVTLHRDVLDGIETGALVPERLADHRRIVLAPRPVAIRAFLQLRQPRAADRITPLLNRRRRTPRPAAVRVPRRSVLGRAPPLVSVCLL